MAVLLMCLTWRKKTYLTPWPLTGALIPFMRAPLSRSNHPPEPLPPNTISWSFRVSRCEFWKDRNIHSTALPHLCPSPAHVSSKETSLGGFTQMWPLLRHQQSFVSLMTFTYTHHLLYGCHLPISLTPLLACELTGQSFISEHPAQNLVKILLFII